VITIRINTENAAFQDNPDEVSRILHDLANRYEAMNRPIHPLYDYNGNRVGEIVIVEPAENQE